jgi:hypothetical protein
MPAPAVGATTTAVATALAVLPASEGVLLQLHCKLQLLLLAVAQQHLALNNSRSSAAVAQFRRVLLEEALQDTKTPTQLCMTQDTIKLPSWLLPLRQQLQTR